MTNFSSIFVYYDCLHYTFLICFLTRPISIS
jgi:hypothetical protein